MIKKIKEKLMWAFTTKLGLTTVAVIWVLLFGIIHNITDAIWAYNAAGIGVIAIAGLVILMVIYAWIINPIRELRKKKKKK